MDILKLTLNEGQIKQKKSADHLKKLEALLTALEQREIPYEVTEKINNQVRMVNSLSGPDKKLLSKIHTSHQQILQILKKEINLTTENYYTYLWLVLGMSVFGIPIGIALFIFTENPGLIGSGIPVGMGIGIFLGIIMDRKAKAEGRVLEIEA